jgi:uncharacterized protein involved in exopolysaccharide biosynthesis
MGELPTQQQSNLQILTGLQGQLQAEQDQLGQAMQHKVLLESLQSQYKTMGGISAKPGESTPSGLAAIDQQLTKEKDALADLLSRYTEQHPDVKKMKEQIAQTEAQRAQLAAELKARAADASGHDAPATVDYGDGRTNAAIMDTASQLKANALEVENRKRSIAELTAQINEYRGRLNSTPAREEELADLMRDDDQSQKDYNALLARKNQAELQANLGKSQEGLQFRVQDPPSLPTKPYAPKRFLFSLGGLAAGLVLGVGVAMGAEFLDHRIYEESDFKKLVNTEILAEIPPLPTAAESSEEQRRFRLEFAAGGVIAAIMLLGVAISFLRG